MKKLLTALTLLLSSMAYSVSDASAAATVKTFTGNDIATEWILSQDEYAEIPVSWGDVTEMGVPVDYNEAGGYPWMTSKEGFNHVSKVEVEIYTEYSRMHVSEVHVGTSRFIPDQEYGLDDNPDKTFIFHADEPANALGQVSIYLYDISRKPLYVKSVKVTYDADGASRDLAWSVDEMTANLGESFTPPTLTGEISGVTYSSSNPGVAEIDASGNILLLSAGMTKITASCPAAYPWAAGECSYMLNVVAELTGAGTSESVMLTAPGTLRDKVLDLESTKIRSLKVSGTINSEDLSYMRETTGRFSNLQALDLTDAILVADGKSYATMFGGNHDVGMGSTNYVFVLSDEEKIEEKGQPTGLGGAKVTVTYYGRQLAGAFNNMTNLKWVKLPSEVSEIAPFLASGCTNLYDIVLPDNYTKIGEGAFSSCLNLHSITHSDECVAIEDRAFANSGILSFDLSKVEEIGESAFKQSSLRGHINLSSLTEVARSAFAECAELKSVEFGGGLTAVREDGFYRSGISGTLYIPEGCESLGQWAFAESAIEGLDLPASCLDMNYGTFNKTPWMEEELSRANIDDIIYAGNVALYYKADYRAHTEEYWTMPLVFREGTTAVATRFGSTIKGVYSYHQPNVVRSLTLPESMIWIGDEAFSNILGGVAEITIPASVRHIGEQAFSDAGVETLSIGANVEYISDYAFARCNSLVRLSYDVPDAGGSYIFFRCEGLESVTIGRHVRNIPKRSFWKCASLRKVEFDGLPTVGIANAPGYAEPERGFSIGISAFSECPYLSTLTLPSDLGAIGEGAFWGAKLRTVFCFASEPMAELQESDLFDSGKSTTIYVPQESVALYNVSSGWRDCTIIGADMSAAIDEIGTDSFESPQEVEIYDLDGILVHTGAYASAQLPTGTYMVKAGKKVCKMIINNLNK